MRCASRLASALCFTVSFLILISRWLPLTLALSRSRSPAALTAYRYPTVCRTLVFHALL